MMQEKIEGNLKIKKQNIKSAICLRVEFSPYTGNKAVAVAIAANMDPLFLENHNALEIFLNEIHIGEDEKKRLFSDLDTKGYGDIPYTQLSAEEASRYFPGQFPYLHVPDPHK